jgi:hypothetical protein
MSMFRMIKSALHGVGHWIGETYCSVGQRVAERIEQISDTVAEQRYLAEHRAEQPSSTRLPVHHVIDVSEFRIINGHKHPN